MHAPLQTYFAGCLIFRKPLTALLSELYMNFKLLLQFSWTNPGASLQDVPISYAF